MATDVARLALQIEVNGAQRARQALKGLQDGSIKAQRATTGLRTAITTSSRSFKVNNQLIKQAGFQVGDFATQIASGQNALVAFTQQFTQLAGFIGPAGPIIGAITAIGGAIAIGLVGALDEGEDSTGELVDRTKELVEQLGEATRRQREFINTDFQRQVQEQERAIQAANEAIFDANTRLERFRRLNQDVPEAVFNSNGAVQELRQTVEDARLSLDNANSSIEATRLAQEEFWKEVEKASEVEREQADELEKLVSGYTAQAAVIGLSARETALYEAARLNATAADRAAINAAFDAIEAEERRQQALKDSMDAQRDFNRDLAQLDPAGTEFNRYADQLDRIEQYNISAREKEMLREEAFRQHQDRMIAIAKQGNDGVATVNAQGLQLFTDSQTAALGVLGQVFGNMASIAEKGGKKQFDTWKTLASAQAAVSTALAVSNALATPPAPLGIALATTVGALGAVQIAQIQATEYQGSFLGGGFTGNGSRTGGLDGKGGFPAILHPNETVIDHTMGQGMGDINVVINNAPAGTSAEVSRGRDGTITIDMFQADMANGGPMSRSMQSTFGMRRQGR